MKLMSQIGTELRGDEKVILWLWNAIVTLVAVNGIIFFPYWVIFIYKWIKWGLPA